MPLQIIKHTRYECDQCGITELAGEFQPLKIAWDFDTTGEGGVFCVSCLLSFERDKLVNTVWQHKKQSKLRIEFLEGEVAGTPAEPDLVWKLYTEDNSLEPALANVDRYTMVQINRQYGPFAETWKEVTPS